MNNDEISGYLLCHLLFFSFQFIIIYSHDWISRVFKHSLILQFFFLTKWQDIEIRHSPSLISMAHLTVWFRVNDKTCRMFLEILNDWDHHFRQWLVNHNRNIAYYPCFDVSKTGKSHSALCLFQPFLYCFTTTWKMFKKKILLYLIHSVRVLCWLS